MVWFVATTEGLGKPFYSEAQAKGNCSEGEKVIGPYILWEEPPSSSKSWEMA